MFENPQFQSATISKQLDFSSFKFKNLASLMKTRPQKKETPHYSSETLLWKVDSI